MILGALPNIDYSPLLDAAWWLLQFAFKWAGFLALMVFALVMIAGAADLLGDIIHWGRRKGKGKRDPVTRTKE